MSNLDELREKLDDLYLVASQGGSPLNSDEENETLRNEAWEEIKSVLSHHLEQEKARVHDEITDNERKVWLYREDLENRLLKARIDELSHIKKPARTNKQTRMGINYLVEDRLKELQAQLTPLHRKDKR